MRNFKKELQRFSEHSTYIAIIFILIPGFLYFELCVVLPTVADAWTFSYYKHILCAIFLLLNIVGNMIYGMFTNTSVKKTDLKSPTVKNWTLCSTCENLRPPRAWHCNECGICILKRDHHCTFFACCIGYHNHRYFMFFTLYVFIAMLYALYYNVIFLSKIIKGNWIMLVLKCIFPLANYVIEYDEESMYIFIIDINVVVIIFTGFLLVYHFNNLLQGKITPERKFNNKGLSYNMGLKINVIEVFGTKWYLTWLSPFVISPLPGNGMEWSYTDLSK